MEQLPRVVARIGSLKQLRELMRAMRALAASRMHEANEALASVRSYTEVVEEAIAAAASLQESDGSGGPGTVEPQEGRDVLLVIGTEHGFVGGLNDRLLSQVAATDGPRRELVAVGRRLAARARERGLAVQADYPMPTHVAGAAGVTRRIADDLVGARSVEVLFAGYRGATASVAERLRILPLAPELFKRTPRSVRPLHHLSPAALLARLAGEYLFAEVTRAVTESLTSENGARLQVMDASDHSIADTLADLDRTAQHLRQEAITAELLDAITGSEAVMGDRQT